MTSDSRQRYVFDINTLVSAYLFPDSLPGKALQHVLVEHRLLLSLEIANEAIEVLRREKFDRYLARERREELIAATIRTSVFLIYDQLGRCMSRSRRQPGLGACDRRETRGGCDRRCRFARPTPVSRNSDLEPARVLGGHRKLTDTGISVVFPPTQLFLSSESGP